MQLFATATAFGARPLGPADSITLLSNLTVDREGIRLGILILPPWWKTWWAYSIYGLLLLLVIIGVDRIQRRRVIEKERVQSAKIELAQAREIEKAYKDLKATQGQLIHAEKMASLGQLTAGIAHEIQNPLNFVNNFAEVSVDMAGELEELIAEGNADEMKAITIDLKDNLQKIFLHGHNLINNAFYAVYDRYKEENEGFIPLVTVKTIKFDHQVQVRVADNGFGIPEPLIEKIFQPFFTTKPAGEGTGLGLSLSYDWQINN